MEGEQTMPKGDEPDEETDDGGRVRHKGPALRNGANQLYPPREISCGKAIPRIDQPGGLKGIVYTPESKKGRILHILLELASLCSTSKIHRSNE